VLRINRPFNPKPEVKTADDADSADIEGMAASRWGGIHFQGGAGKSFSIRVIREISGSNFGVRV
jgi:hypothetical protein